MRAILTFNELIQQFLQQLISEKKINSWNFWNENFFSGVFSGSASTLRKVRKKVGKYCKVEEINCQKIIYGLIVCFYHVTYEFESESTLYSCLNVKELLARSRRHIWRLSDCNGTRTHNHLVRLNGWVFVYELSGCGFESRCSHLIIYGLDLTLYWLVSIWEGHLSLKG